jgi:hypothetical protein
MNDKETRYDLFKCRLAGAAGMKAQLALIVGVFLSLLLYTRIKLQ